MGLYPCAPGGPNDYVYIMTSRANPDHWDRLLKLIGREDLIGDKRYLTPTDRVAREAGGRRDHRRLDAAAAPSTKRCELVGEAGIPAGAVLDTMELQNDQSFERRGIMQTMHHPVHRRFKMPGWPVRVDGKPSQLKPSPVLASTPIRCCRLAGPERSRRGGVAPGRRTVGVGGRHAAPEGGDGAEISARQLRGTGRAAH